MRIYLEFLIEVASEGIKTALEILLLFVEIREAGNSRLVLLMFFFFAKGAAKSVGLRAALIQADKCARVLATGMYLAERMPHL